ncbi:MAG: DUF1194 domain-containing protein [Alphaproteobacteria bacterium]|nr:DUF1194 domain-containing protein [Alphaproteobacteria bacterium]
MLRAIATTCLAAALVTAPGDGPAAAQVPVDTALVLVVDSSGSIDEGEFRLQKEGIAAAVTSPRVLAAVASGPFRRLAVAYVEWGSPGGAETVVGWMLVEDARSAAAFADAVVAAPRSAQSYNAIGDAIDHAALLLSRCPCEATRKVVDLSGDNADMRSLNPVAAARDAAVARGVTVNALAILENDRIGPTGRPWLVEYYERAVIGGPGAFVVAARDRADFTRALLDKMVLEVAGAALPGPSVAATPSR